MVAATQEVASVSKISIKDVSSKEVVLSAEIPWSLQACKTRAVLTKQQAIRIFEIKLASNSGGIEQPSAQLTAHHFGVSEKAIRDIWKGRTWIRETMHLDPERAVLAGLLRLPGRPEKSKPNRQHYAKGKTDCAMSWEAKTASSIPSACGFPAIADEFQSAPPKNPMVDSTRASTRAQCTHFFECGTEALSAVHCQPGWIWASWMESEPLPQSYTAEDPFHDDWPHWAPTGNAESGPAVWGTQ